MARLNQLSGNGPDITSSRLRTRPCGSITRDSADEVIAEARRHAMHEPHHRFTQPAELAGSGGKWQSLVWHEMAGAGAVAEELHA